MKLQPDASSGTSITGYGTGWVSVNGEKFQRSVYVSASAGCQPWDCPGFEALLPEHFGMFAAMQPELIIFGSGARIRFPHPSLLQSLYAQRIGVETMDTQAACRTYNFLAAEGRRVIAALLV